MWAHRKDSWQIVNDPIALEGAKSAFCAALRETGTVQAAVDVVGFNRRTVYTWRAEDEAFAAAWDAAVEAVDDSVEAALLARARKGDVIACIFWLKCRRPLVYNDKPATRDVNVRVQGEVHFVPAQRRAAPLVIDAAVAAATADSPPLPRLPAQGM